MNILVVNDDGIQSKGIKRLTEMAIDIGNVIVVAPKQQCSAMSHKITVSGQIEVKREAFPVKATEAYSVAGTPADCVKIGTQILAKEKIDIVFSGINDGYNIGVDILYSGTIGAAMEALNYNIPAIAFSMGSDASFSVVDRYLEDVTRKLLTKKISTNEIWNVNFPECAGNACKGILEERLPEQRQFYQDRYKIAEAGKEYFILEPLNARRMEAEEMTDMKAVMDGYVSIGKIKNTILG